MDATTLLSTYPKVGLIVGIVGFFVAAVPKIVVAWEHWSARRNGKNEADLLMRKLELIRQYHEVEAVKQQHDLETLEVEHSIRESLRDFLQLHSQGSATGQHRELSTAVEENEEADARDSLESGEGHEKPLSTTHSSGFAPQLWRWVGVLMNLHRGLAALGLTLVVAFLGLAGIATGVFSGIAMLLLITEPGNKISYLGSSVVFGAMTVYLAKRALETIKQIALLRA